MISGSGRRYDFQTASMSQKDVNKKWLLVDVSNEYVGRIASKIASVLKGKNKVNYTPFLDMGDNIVVVNAGSLLFSGDKWNKKQYIRHTGYPGGQRISLAKDIKEKDPCRILIMAVKGMLPKNRLGRKLLKNMRVFRDNEHNMGAQNPMKITL